MLEMHLLLLCSVVVPAAAVARYLYGVPGPEVGVLGEVVGVLDVGHAHAVAHGQAAQVVVGCEL